MPFVAQMRRSCSPNKSLCVPCEGKSVDQVYPFRERGARRHPGGGIISVVGRKGEGGLRIGNARGLRSALAMWR
jgi:hypothetical protein